MIALVRHAAHALLTVVFERWMRLVIPTLAAVGGSETGGNRPDDQLAAIKADEQLLEDLRAGLEPPTDDQLLSYLAALRDDAQRPVNPQK